MIDLKKTIPPGYNKPIHLIKFALWKILARIIKNTTLHTSQGVFRLKVAKHDVIAQSLFCLGNFEADIISESLSYLRNQKLCPPKGNGTILDIGANNGVISIAMIHTEEMERAIAIEPEPGNFSILEMNVRLNKMEEKVLPLNYAASSEEGDMQFELSPYNYGDHRARIEFQNSEHSEKFYESQRDVIQVPSKPIDELLRDLPGKFVDNISLIWIDIQGFEGFAFQGAEQLFKKGIPVISEFWPYGIHRSGMKKEEFINIAKKYWKFYCVKRRTKYIKYPIDTLFLLFEELENWDEYENIIYLP